MQLYHPAFVNFIQEISQPIEKVDFDHEELDQAADFIYASLDFFQDENSRQICLNKLEGALGKLAIQELSIDARIIKLDGITTVRCSSGEEAVVRIVELKNEIGEGDSDPIAQAECGFVIISSSDQVAPRFSPP